ncbi:unnamed protein product [Vitrella brassicaformis CCMP3155]|uniref:Uncharacterized protein n=1 Tax=Vitrella brassicaformis (strain CCMP3155) TaxID=1169540 RepID=A0A0G4GNM6_VITBC|nr:unnamed protein product [Vitrella brassicaformis CCMP3155]|eukprot:CEM31701.1 unnamed protein product [Vitrella brassicaformis CCMP3155]
MYGYGDRVDDVGPHDAAPQERGGDDWRVREQLREQRERRRERREEERDYRARQNELQRVAREGRDRLKAQLGSLDDEATRLSVTKWLLRFIDRSTAIPGITNQDKFMVLGECLKGKHVVAYDQYVRSAENIPQGGDPVDEAEAWYESAVSNILKDVRGRSGVNETYARHVRTERLGCPSYMRDRADLREKLAAFDDDLEVAQMHGGELGETEKVDKLLNLLPEEAKHFVTQTLLQRYRQAQTTAEMI